MDNIFIILIILAVMYLASFFLVNTGRIRLFTHRRFWNSLLLISFVIVASIGIIFALEIKLSPYWLNRLLLLHIQAGTMMISIAFLHIIWFWRNLK